MSYAIATGLPAWLDTSRTRPAKGTDFRLEAERCFLSIGHFLPHIWIRISLDAFAFPILSDCVRRIRVTFRSGGVNLPAGDPDGYATRELAEAWIAAAVADGAHQVQDGRARRRR